MKILNACYRLKAPIKLKVYDLLFGKGFVHGKISFRNRMTILVEKPGRLEIGSGCFFNNDCSITCMNKIVIGENTIFGEGVKVYDHNYHINTNALTKNAGHAMGTVIVGKNCWIGSNVVLLKGASIGDNCVIGAGCIIDGTIKDNTIVKGKHELIISDLRRDSERM